MQGQQGFLGQKPIDVFKDKNKFFGGSQIGISDDQDDNSSQQQKPEDQKKQFPSNIDDDDSEDNPEAWNTNRILDEAKSNHTFIFDVQAIKANLLCEQDKAQKMCCDQDKYNINVKYYEKFQKNEKLQALQKQCDQFKKFCKCVNFK